MPKVKFTGRDWDMHDGTPGDIVVDGLVMAVKGCGDNDDPLAVIDSDGTELRLLGVRRNGHRVEIVIGKAAK